MALDHGIAHVGLTLEQGTQHPGPGLVQAGGHELAPGPTGESGASPVYDHDVLELHEEISSEFL
jgi:hypothetical protein